MYNLFERIRYLKNKKEIFIDLNFDSLSNFLRSYEEVRKENKDFLLIVSSPKLKDLQIGYPCTKKNVLFTIDFAIKSMVSAWENGESKVKIIHLEKG